MGIPKFIGSVHQIELASNNLIFLLDLKTNNLSATHLRVHTSVLLMKSQDDSLTSSEEFGPKQITFRHFHVQFAMSLDGYPPQSHSRQ